MALLPRKRDEQRSLWDPFSEMEKLRDEMNRLFDFSRLRWPEKGMSIFDTAWTPSIDVMEDKDKVILKADLPGLSKDDIKVSVKEDSLVIEGEKSTEKEAKEGSYVRAERTYGSFYREIALPGGADTSKVNAEYRNGVLKLTMPKKEETKPKQIDIEIK